MKVIEREETRLFFLREETHSPVVSLFSKPHPGFYSNSLFSHPSYFTPYQVLKLPQADPVVPVLTWSSLGGLELLVEPHSPS